MVQQEEYIMRPHFPQVGLEILCPLLYTIFCGHTYVLTAQKNIAAEFSIASLI